MAINKNPQKIVKEGKAAFKKGNYDKASQLFLEAREAYLASGETLAAAEMANNQSVAFLQSGNANAALEVVNGTDEIFAEAGDRHRQALALGNKAAALEELESLEEAAETYESSANILKEIGENDLRASVMQSLSAVQLKQGRQLQALATMQTGLENVQHPNPKQRVVKKLLQIPFNFMNRK
jgi:tetratricopeptide (TPR) repeat protein